VGAVVWATTQMEQEAGSVLLAWWCVDSAAAVHSISDKQNQADHRVKSLIYLYIPFIFNLCNTVLCSVTKFIETRADEYLSPGRRPQLVFYAFAKVSGQKT